MENIFQKANLCMFSNDLVSLEYADLIPAINYTQNNLCDFYGITGLPYTICAYLLMLLFMQAMHGTNG